MQTASLAAAQGRALACSPGARQCTASWCPFEVCEAFLKLLVHGVVREIFMPLVPRRGDWLRLRHFGLCYSSRPALLGPAQECWDAEVILLLWRTERRVRYFIKLAEAGCRRIDFSPEGALTP